MKRWLIFFLLYWEYVPICEGEANNLALYRPTRQKKTISTQTDVSYTYFLPHLAVDGDRSGVYRYSWSCSVVESDETLSWWYVDLEGTYEVRNVTMVSRQDIFEDFEPFMITLHTSPPKFPLPLEYKGQICGVQRQNLPAGSIQTYNCPTPNVASIVAVQQLAKDHLAICETEVYGEVVEKSSCMARYVEIHDTAAAVSSGCSHVKSLTVEHYGQCVVEACGQNANLLNFKDGQCEIRNCREQDYELTLSRGAWTISVLVDECWTQFNQISRKEMKARSSCGILKIVSQTTVGECQIHACQEDANVINFKDGLCELLDCPDGPKLIHDEDGWDIFRRQWDIIREQNNTQQTTAETVVNPEKCTKSNGKDQKSMVYLIVVGILAFANVMLVIISCYFWRKSKSPGEMKQSEPTSQSEETYQELDTSGK